MSGDDFTSVDLRTPPQNTTSVIVETNELPKQSKVWAEIVKPFGILVFILLCLVIILPFISIIIWPGTNKEVFHQTIVDWGKTVLAPVIGLASAVATYYFGTGYNKTNQKMD